MQIDAEMTDRLDAVSRGADNPWQGFVDECVAYVEMALEPEIQRIVHRDGPAVLGDPFSWTNQSGCISSLTGSVSRLQEEGYVRPDIDPEGAARVINGASIHTAQWIARADDPEAVSAKAVGAFKAMLEGLLKGRLSDE